MGTYLWTFSERTWPARMILNIDYVVLGFMASEIDIRNSVNEYFVFSTSQIAEFAIIYNLPSWPKSIKRVKIDSIKDLLESRLDWIVSYGCVKQDIHNLSELLVNKCLYTCDIAEYAQKIPLIGQMIMIGKFYTILRALKSAIVGYVYKRSLWSSADEALNYSKWLYWQSILDVLPD